MLTLDRVPGQGLQFFFSSRRRHTRWPRDWSSDVCSSDLPTSTKAVMAWFPPAQRATVIGLKQVGLPFGGALGAALMPALALAVGWRLAVVTSALVILSTAVASLLIYRDPAGLPRPRRERARPSGPYSSPATCGWWRSPR